MAFLYLNELGEASSEAVGIPREVICHILSGVTSRDEAYPERKIS